MAFTDQFISARINKNPTTENANKILEIANKYKEKGITSTVGSATSDVGYKFGIPVPFRDRLVSLMTAAGKKGIKFTQMLPPCIVLWKF